MPKQGDDRQEGYIAVPGGQIWYRVVRAGKGVPLLTLHGGPGTPHDYLEPLEGLAHDRPVIFYDQLGCGKSERPDDPSLWQRQRFVEELEQIRQALKLEQVHLFGHSWGSMLAIDYALTRPPGLRSLILASPALSIPRWLQDMEQYRNNLPDDVQMILKQHENNGTTDSEEYQQAAMVFYRQYLCRLNPWPELLERTLAGEGTEVYQTMWGPSEFFMTGNLLHYDAIPYLDTVDIPTLLTCGRYDEAAPETTAWYQSLLPHSELAIFEQSAHMPHLEETPKYLRVLSNFLWRVESLNM
ncbi:MAG TPA: proline iminopeptidase-family hydrolase [Ktedonobacteraceae bacterium]|jgi:proline iminopeptidase|nr:proline iminopeptidase-family hydrolase [Ktedonobacteraceae bacterium]